MKGKFLVLAMLLVLVAVPMVGAQGGGSWDSSFTVINLGTGEATVTVTFYTEAGVAVTPTDLGGGTANPFALAAGSSKEILVFQIPEAQLAAGRYSVVISADQPVAAIANLTNTIQAGQAPSFNGSYSGFDTGEMELFMPAALQDYYGWNSHFSMQNMTGTAMNLTLELYQEGSNTVCHTEGPRMVEAYSSWHVDIGALALVDCDQNADGYNGAGKVSASGAVGAIDNQTHDATGMTVTYRGFPSGANTIYVPGLYVAYYSWDSSINIQNVSAVPTDVDITYSDGVTAQCSDLQPGAGCLLLNFLETGHAEKFSAVIDAVDAGAALVAVAQAGTSAASMLNQAFAYEAFLAGGTNFGLPLTMDMYYGWFTSFTMQNLGGTDAAVTYVYAPDTTTTPPFAGQSCNTTIPANSNLEIVQTQDTCVDLPAGYHGGVTVEATSGGPIIVIVSQNNVDQMSAAPGDWSMSYDGVGQ